MQADSQAESINKIVMALLKKRLEEYKSLSVDELLGVLWAYPITSKTSIGEAPFALTYGSEAVSPIEVEIRSL